MTVNIYTEQERIFLHNVLELFNVEYETEQLDTVISSIKFTIKANTETEDIIKRCMLWNYKKNFG